MPNLAARSWIEIASLTPPTRHASSWQTSIASAWKSCLKTTRFWMCSPVATRTGAISRRIRAWPRMSSGLVGSSIHQGSCARSVRIAAIASSTPQTWLASIIRIPVGPSSRRIRAARRSSEARSLPTFIFTCVKPDATASRTSDSTFAVVVAEPAGRRRVGGVAGRDDLGLPGRRSRVARRAGARAPPPVRARP